jgi:hypothetical protein
MRKIIVVIIITAGFLFAAAISNKTVQGWTNNYAGFEENLGQVTDMENNPVSSVLYRLNLPECNIFITETGASFVLYQNQNNQISFARFDVEPVGCKIDKRKIELSDEVVGYSNYYLSHCPNGIMYVKSYRYIKIKDLYPGIDWVWRYDNKVHSEFVVRPNADISQIKLNVKWADTDLNDGKELVYSTPLGKIHEGEIYVYENEGRQVSAYYKKDEQGFITFDIKGHDKNKTLVIDPPLERLWATYYGGSGQDNCDGSRTMGAITTDLSGNIFVTGFTSSTNFPTNNPGGSAYFQGSNAGSMDVFILKFSNTGAREWATYYGGSNDEMGISIATDDSQNVFVTGNTFSTSFPTYNPGGGAYYQTSGGTGDVFILKFTNTGIRTWATCYCGGSSDVGYSIAADDSGNIFVTGNTYSSNLPTYNPGGGAYFQGSLAGSFDAFVLKFSDAGVREWATYYGGSDDDIGYSLATDISGNVFLTGMTRSTNFPIYDAGGGAYYQTSILGYRTVFILKFSNVGVREWATYYGGSTNDYGLSIATDTLGKIFVTGNTSSTNFPTFDPSGGAYFQTSNAGSDDAFILKFSNAGVREWATYYGGTAVDVGRSITIDDSGNLFITGNTLSSNLPIYNPGGGAYYQSTLTGGHEAFIIGFSNIGVREWATYYGGTSTDYGMSITSDVSGNIFLTGFSLSANFPTYNPGGSAYFQGTNAGSYDAYILKFASVTSGIEENPAIPQKQEFQVLYNTFFSDRIILKFINFKEREIKTSIFDALGSVLYEKISSSSSFLILDDEEIRNLKSGIYFIRIESKNQALRSIKVIKK